MRTQPIRGAGQRDLQNEPDNSLIFNKHSQKRTQTNPQTNHQPTFMVVASPYESLATTLPRSARRPHRAARSSLPRSRAEPFPFALRAGIDNWTR